MRALVQRVKEASVSIDGNIHNAIERGLLILLGIKQGDTEDAANYLAHRCTNARIFEDDQGRMNLSVKDIGGSVLVISQFTLYADTRKGNRPSFTDAASPEIAEELYDKFVYYLQEEIGTRNVKTGIFREMMDIQLINTGPTTIIIDSKDKT